MEPSGDPEDDLEGRATAFEVRGRRRKGKKAAPGSHEVTFTVTCALALNSTPPIVHGATNGIVEGSVTQGDGESQTGQPSRGGVGPDVPRAFGYYHLEHKLFPDDTEPMRTDVINYGVAARVYPERSDSRTIKTWACSSNAENVVWVAWSQSVKTAISNDMLKSVASHEVVLRAWDSKEKCSSRCRWDTKPKAFRFPPPKPGQDPENVGGVKANVLRLSKSFERLLGSKMTLERPLPHYITAPSILRPQNAPGPSEKAEKQKEQTYGLYAVPKADREPNARSYSRLLRLAATDVEPEKRSGGGGGSRTASRTAKGGNSDPK